MLKDKRIIYLVISCLVYVGLLVGIPYVRAPKNALTLLVVIAAFMFVQLCISRWFASTGMRAGFAAGALGLCILVWIGTVFVVTAPYARYDIKGYGPVPIVMQDGRRPALREIGMRRQVSDSNGKVIGIERVKVTGVLRPAGLGFKILIFDNQPKGQALANLLKILAATAFGYLVSFILRHPNIILPVGALAAYMDIWTVLVGPTAKAIEKVPHVVSAVSVQIPDIASSGGGFQPLSMIGPADFIFLAMFFGAIYRLKMEPARTLWMIFPVLTLGMFSVMRGFPPMGLPALVLIGPTVIVANYKHFKLEKQEWVAVGITAVLLVAITIVAMPYLLHR